MGIHAHINRCFVNLRMVKWFIRFSSESHNYPKMICNNFKICLLIFYLLFVCLLEYQHRLHLRLNCVRLSVRILDILWPPEHCLPTRTSKLTPFSYPHGFLLREFDINKYNGCVNQTTMNNDTELYMDNFRHIKLSQWILNLTVNYL